MVRVLAGKKGEGKTKRLIEMANDLAKVTKGHLIYMDDDNRPMYDLARNIRFIKTTDYPISSSKELFGFLNGVLSQDTDVHVIYIDGLLKMVEFKDDEELVEFVEGINKLYEMFDVDFVVTISKEEEEVPESIKKYLWD